VLRNRGYVVDISRAAREVNWFPKLIIIVGFKRSYDRSLHLDSVCGVFLYQNELKKWAVWFCANKMAVNVSKTKFILFQNRGKKVNLNGKEISFFPDPTSSSPSLLKESIITILTLVNAPTSFWESSLMKNLTFEYQVNSLRNKLTRSFFIINRVKHFVPHKSLRDLYYALFHSHLTYCPIITSCATKTNLEKISVLQKKVIRIVSNSNYRAHTEPLFKQLKILPYPKLIEQSKLLFMHSVHYNYAPPIFSNVWPKNDSRNINQHLRNSEQYTIPRPKTSSFTRFPLTSLPVSWNNAGNFKYHSNSMLKFHAR